MEHDGEGQSFVREGRLLESLIGGGRWRPQDHQADDELHHAAVAKRTCAQSHPAGGPTTTTTTLVSSTRLLLKHG